MVCSLLVNSFTSLVFCSRFNEVFSVLILVMKIACISRKSCAHPEVIALSRDKAMRRKLYLENSSEKIRALIR